MSYLQVTPTFGENAVTGRIPGAWTGVDAIDGDAGDFLMSPVGMLYIYKPDESTEPRIYYKMADNGEDADWFQVQMGSGSQVRTKKLAVSALTTGEKDTGWDLPAKSAVLNVYVDVRTAESTSGTKTIDVGLLSSESGGDTDGFLDGVSTATTGIKKGTLLNTGQTLGALLRVDESGAGVLVPEPHIVATAKSVVYQLGAAHTELVADIYVHYIQFGL